MAFKRKNKINKSRFNVKGRKKITRKRPSSVTLQNVAKRLKLMSKTIETKSGVQLISDNILFRHNNANIISSSFMNTGNGTIDSKFSTVACHEGTWDLDPDDFSLRTCTRCSLRIFVFRVGDLTSDHVRLGHLIRTILGSLPSVALLSET